MGRFDYLVVGSGLFGSVFAYLSRRAGKKVLVIEKRPQVGGNLYCECVEGINVHSFGAHIFHTSNQRVWDFVNSHVDFNNYINAPVANYRGKLYNLPFNMNTFYALWGVTTPDAARAKIEEQRKEAGCAEPRNLEEQAIALVGRDIYEILVKGYTEKQWGRPCSELPAFIIKRLPVRFVFDNNYFNDRYQGIPVGGYNTLIAKLLDGVEVKTGTDFFEERGVWEGCAEKVVYTGPIDRYFDYCFGKLEYRALRFEHETLDCPNYQGNAVVNYTDAAVPWTRILEHKHFEFGSQNKTVITKEYPAEWQPGGEPFYPVNDDRNNALYARYADMAKEQPSVLFGGRLAEYKYYDMDKTIESALVCSEAEFGSLQNTLSL